MTWFVYRWRLTSSAKVVEQAGLGYAAALVLGAAIGGYGAGTLNLWLSGTHALARSIVGALAGAILSVEIYKASRGIRGSTGLIFVPAFATTCRRRALGLFFRRGWKMKPMARRADCPGRMIWAMASCAIPCSSMSPSPWPGFSPVALVMLAGATVVVHAQWLLRAGAVLCGAAIPLGVPQALCRAARTLQSVPLVCAGPDWLRLCHDEGTAMNAPMRKNRPISFTGRRRRFARSAMRWCPPRSSLMTAMSIISSAARPMACPRR